jgi:hypothetical protein
MAILAHPAVLRLRILLRRTADRVAAYPCIDNSANYIVTRGSASAPIIGFEQSKAGWGRILSQIQRCTPPPGRMEELGTRELRPRRSNVFLNSDSTDSEVVLSDRSLYAPAGFVAELRPRTSSTGHLTRCAQPAAPFKQSNGHSAMGSIRYVPGNTRQGAGGI